MIILGVSALYHDSAAAIVVDGEIVAAAQEERFTRKKHDSGIPKNAITFCMKAAEISAEDIDYVAFYDDPFEKIDRFTKNVLSIGLDSQDLIHYGVDNYFSKAIWIRELLKEVIPSIGRKTKFYVTKHHISHASSAFFPSPFSKSVILTLDGVGEWNTLSIGVGTNNYIELKEVMNYPHSLGLFYSAFTYFCGFKVNSGEYKFMGLAPYGKPIYYNVICDEIINIKQDGSFRLNMNYFDYHNGRTMVNEEKMTKLLGSGRRLPESIITQREMNIAASVQKITEEIVLKIVRHAKGKYGRETDNLVMAGGVALNCVSNGKIANSNIFKNIWIQPAAGDAGGALGSALYLYYQFLGNTRNADGYHDFQKKSYLGPEFSDEEIEQVLVRKNAKYHYLDELPYEYIANLICEQKVIGIFEGRMEFGPRALGNRSIIADPRNEEMQARLNIKTKNRESFRPFAPVVLREDVEKYYKMKQDSPYMLFCSELRDEWRVKFDLQECMMNANGDMTKVIKVRRSQVPAVTHIDYSARVQTIDKETNTVLYEILRAFKRISNCGVLINTSFNVRGEPIVCAPEDAWRCFMRTDIDVLIMGKYMLFKEEQQVYDDANLKGEYELD